MGFFKIGEITEKPVEETMLIADASAAVRLSMEEARELYFWDYYSTKGGPIWGTGLVRYLNDNQTCRILKDLGETVRDEKVKEIIEGLLVADFVASPSEPPSPRIK